MKTSKATREQLRRHNRELILRAVYSGLANNRAALAQETGLAKPTVSDVISELIADGLLVEGGRGESTDSGGKRPRLLEFVPDARQIIGVSIKTDHVRGVLANLNGQVFAEHYADLEDARGKRAVALLQEVINGLVAQLNAPLLCIGIGVSGDVDPETGTVHAAHFGWQRQPLAATLSRFYEAPVHVANSTELAAMAEHMFGVPETVHNLVTILINNRVGIGVVLDGAAYHNGSEIGELQIAAGGAAPYTLDDLLSWPSVQARALDLRRQHPGGLLPERGLSYLHLRHAAANGDRAALLLQAELAGYLAQIYAWVIALLRPQHVSLAGHIVELGEPFLAQTLDLVRRQVPAALVDQTHFSLADSWNLVALGAVAYTLQMELGLV